MGNKNSNKNKNKNKNQYTKIIGYTGDGKRVYISSKSNWLQNNEISEELIKSALKKVGNREGLINPIFSKGMGIDMSDYYNDKSESEIPYSQCIEVDENSNTFLAKRIGKKGETNFVLGVAPKKCTTLTMILKNAPKGDYNLVTSYIGEPTPLEPWDEKMENATQEEKDYAEKFWKTHALVYNPTVIESINKDGILYTSKLNDGNPNITDFTKKYVTGKHAVKEERKTLILMIGSAASGKSTVAKEFVENYKNKKGQEVKLFSSDEIRKELYPAGRHTVEENENVYNVLISKVEESLSQGFITIADATFLGKNNRERIYEIAKQEEAELNVVVVKVSEETVLKQNKERNKRLPANEQLSDEFVLKNYAEFCGKFDEILNEIKAKREAGENVNGYIYAEEPVKQKEDIEPEL